MRLRTFARRAVWGVALLLALVGGPTGPVGIVHLSLDDDPACHLPLVSESGALPALSIGDASFDVAAGHCGTCHGLCSLRYQAPPLVVVARAEHALGWVAVARARSVDVDTPLQLPARAPPSLRT